MSLGRLALLAQLATTLPLVGLIWLVQIVSYPLFAQVGADAFAAYHRAHVRRITFVVAPLMSVELAASLVSTVYLDPALPQLAAWLGAALALATWLCTGLLVVPQHDVLARRFEGRAHALLVRSNWLRTAAWSGRAALLLFVLARAL